MLATAVLAQVLVVAPAHSDPTPHEPATNDRPLLSLYEPIYAVSDVNGGDQIKLQLSFKLEIVPAWQHLRLFVGYTQRTFFDAWDRPRSAPIVGTDYFPEVFSRYHFAPGEPEPSGVEFVQLGYRHESNGVGNEPGQESRRWDLIYLEGTATYRFGQRQQNGRRHAASASLRVWLPVRIAADNSDLPDYVGYGELRGKVSLVDLQPWFGGDVEVDVALRKGTGGLKRGSLQLSLSTRPWRLARWATPFIYVQLFHGHAERLISYNESTTNIRVGIAFRPR